MARTRYPIWKRGGASVPLSPGTGRGARLHQPRSGADPTPRNAPGRAARGGGRDPAGRWSGRRKNRPGPGHRARTGNRRTGDQPHLHLDRKSTRLNSSHVAISYAVFCLKKKKKDLYSLLLYSNKRNENAVTMS